MPKLIRVEFHCHTTYSPDSWCSLRRLENAARKTGLDRIVVTDHNTFKGARLAAQAAPDLFIPGEEILTTRGELLAAFVREEVPRKLEPLQAIERLKEQGAFISVSHPLDAQRGWQLEALEEILPLIDAIEVFNARCVRPEYNRFALTYAQQHNLAGTAGSDAHTIREVGRASMKLPEFKDAAELRAVIRQAQFETRLSHPMIHFSSTVAMNFNRLFRRGEFKYFSKKE